MAKYYKILHLPTATYLYIRLDMKDVSLEDNETLFTEYEVKDRMYRATTIFASKEHCQKSIAYSTVSINFRFDADEALTSLQREHCEIMEFDDVQNPLPNNRIGNQMAKILAKTSSNSEASSKRDPSRYR